MPGEMFGQCQGIHASPERAISACTGVLAWRELKREDMPLFLESRGNAYIKVGRYVDATRDFHAAYTIDSSDIDALAGGCRARAIGNFDLDVALTRCNLALERQEDDGDALEARALIRLRRGDYAKARADLDVELRKASKPAGAYYLRGLAKSKLNDASAADDFAAAKAMDPAVAEYYAGIGITP